MIIFTKDSLVKRYNNQKNDHITIDITIDITKRMSRYSFD